MTKNPFQTPEAEKLRAAARRQNVGNFLLWFGLAIAAGAVLARLAVLVAPRFAPLIAFPMLLGLFLGVVIAALQALSGWTSLSGAIAGAILVALVTVGLEHYFFYLEYRANFERAIDSQPEAALARSMTPDMGPASFWTFLRASASWGQAMLWILDGLIIVAATCCVVGTAQKRRSVSTDHLPREA